MKRLFLFLLFSSAVSASTVFDPSTATLTIDRLPVAGDANEFRDITVKFNDLSTLTVIKSTRQLAFFDQPFYSSPIVGYNGVARDSLFQLDNGLIFKVLDNISLPYTTINTVTIYKRNDNTWFASLGSTFFNIEPFIYGVKRAVTVNLVSSTGNVFLDSQGVYWRINQPNVVAVGMNVIIYNDNVTLVNGKTVTLEKF